MRTFTFAGGTISPGFVLSKNEQDGRNEQVLALGEYGRGSWLTNIPLNSNPENRPEVSDNMVADTFLLNVGGDQRPFFVMLRDRGQNNGSCLIRLLTVGESGEGNGFVQRISGFRSKPLVGGHGRNNGVLPDNGTWSDEVWVVHERELLRVQLAGCNTAYDVRVRDGEPMVEPWVEREPQQKPVAVSGNGGNGNGKRQWQTLKGSHTVAVSSPTKVWSPGVGEQLAELDQELAEFEAMARATGGKRAGTTTPKPGQQLVSA